MSRKSSIIAALVTELKRIDGSTDTRASVPSSPYTFKSDVDNRVTSQFKYINEVNDFPAITLTVSREEREHIGGGIKYGIIIFDIRGYVRTENALNAADNLLEDIEYIIESIGHLDTFCPYEVVDSRVIRLSTDEGLFEPYGIVDMEAIIRYQIEENV